MCIQATGKKLAGKESCLWEAIHPFFYADIHPTVKDLLSEAVFAYDFVGKDVVLRFMNFGCSMGVLR